MHIAAVLALQVVATGSSARAQSAPHGASSPAEEALRSRVRHFYSLQAESKFRASEACVCDDTKDYYYDLAKRPPRSFEISSIEFDKARVEAKVITIVSGELTLISGVIPVSLPVPTQWRLENNQWCFFVPVERQKVIQTPFGEIKANSTPPGAGPRTVETPAFSPVRVEDVQSAVGMSAESVVFEAAKAATAEIELTNALEGRVQIAPPLSLPPGLQLKLDRTRLNAKEKATVRFEYSPPPELPAPVYVLRFEIEPTRQVIPIQVRFERAPAEKQPSSIQSPRPPAKQ